jgi:Flp pilus assembly protein CpaB
LILSDTKKKKRKKNQPNKTLDLTQSELQFLATTFAQNAGIKLQIREVEKNQEQQQQQQQQQRMHKNEQKQPE